jgi:hypothetical protein
LPFGIEIAFPLLGVIAAVIAKAYGLGRVVSSMTIGLSLIISVVSMVQGVHASCALGESECNGATVTAYLVGFFWIIVVVAGFVAVGRVSLKRTNISELKD